MNVRVTIITAQPVTATVPGQSAQVNVRFPGGNTGPQGPAGPQGEIGPRGPTGLQGESGGAFTYTVASLMALTDMVHEQFAYIREGDGIKGPRWFNASSTATHDGNETIKPTSIAPGDPGRWEKIIL